MKKLLLLTAAGLVLQATPVLAQPHEGGPGDGPRGPGKMFEKHDANGDGVISEAEFLASAKEKFAEMDKDGNGSISQEEVKASHEERREKMKEMRDKWKEKRGDRMKDDSEKAPE
ncbi:MAG TPA: EF-hand domain-containing protein [Alphaproteobacteria bacterium]|nr:EF-hand domain-containing protein [Alphaproteobacteria bacterium]